MIETTVSQYPQSVPSLMMANQSLHDINSSLREMHSSWSSLVNQFVRGGELITSVQHFTYILCQKLSQIVTEWRSLRIIQPRQQQLLRGRRTYRTRNFRFLNHSQLLLLMVLATVHAASAALQQQVEFCSCTPQKYRWRLDFNKLCFDREKLSSDGGVEDAECYVSLPNHTDIGIPSKDGVDRSKPACVTSYKIIEFGGTLDNLVNLKYQSKKMFQPLLDGDIIRFESITESKPNVITSGISIHLNARNADGEDVTLDVIIRYDNTCKSEPFQEGESLGWLVFVSSASFVRYYYFCGPLPILSLFI